MGQEQASGITEVRNIAIVGHEGSGKTTLVEALLAAAGAKPAPGSVERGDTTTDYDPLEQRYQHSLGLGAAGFDYKGRRINLLDAPGYIDFVGQTLSALAAVETMAVVVNAQTGIETLTRRLMDWAAGMHLPTMVIINKIDAAPDKLDGLLAELSEAFGKECLPLELPRGHAEAVVEVYDHDSGEADFSSVAEAHEALMEQVVEVDETAMEHYLEQGGLERSELHDAFEKALRERHLIPVCFTSARTGAGVAELLEVLAELAPSPLEGNPHPLLHSKAAEEGALWPRAEAGAPLLAHVFKVEFDPFMGKLALLRIHQGRLRKGSEVLVGPQGSTIKIAHLYRVQGKAHEETDAAAAGDICALAKIDALEQDLVVHDSHDDDDLALSGIHYPTPLVGLALKAKRRGDEQKLSDVLHKLVAEDPCLTIEHDMTANETVLRGLGDLHLRVALEKLDERFHVEVDTHPPSIPYKETITRKAGGHHRHKKQTGGAGQFGEVMLEVEPLPTGTGFEFVDKVTGGAIPGQFIPAVEKGVRQVMASGAVAGYPMQDLRVTVLDGKHHSVDSKEVAFVAAGRKAFLDAVDKAGPIVLEPIVDMEVTAPAAAMGDISGDLSSRRARISQTEAGADGELRVNAQVPLAELEDYASRLKSMTGGEGSWSIQFSHYEPAPARVQKELESRHSRKEE